MATKGKYDRAAALASSMNDEKEQVTDRFSTARKALAERPGGLATPATAAAAPLSSGGGTSSDLTNPSSAATEQGAYIVGKTYDVHISSLREPRRGARVFYRPQDIDKMGKTMGDSGQEVPVKGYVEGDHIILVDGVTRLRSAKSTGESTLRVEICEKPENERDLYLKSRRINLERSSQTVLDDAVRWKEMIDEGLFKDQQDIAGEVGRDQSQVSRILNINKIPMALLMRMKDHDSLCTYTAATEIARLFDGPKYEQDPGAIEIMVDHLLDDILRGELSTRQIVQLVNSKLEGPKTRVRNESRPVHYAGVKGAIKINERTGDLLFEVKGIKDSSKLEKLRKSIEAICEKSGEDASP